MPLLAVQVVMAILSQAPAPWYVREASVGLADGPTPSARTLVELDHQRPLVRLGFRGHRENHPRRADAHGGMSTSVRRTWDGQLALFDREPVRS